MNRIQDNQIEFGAFNPIGSGMLWFTTSAPTNYLICDGSEISRTTYADLFSLIGTTYGSGDGSTTFNLPDLRQRFPLGKADSGTGSTLAGTGGAIDHNHTTSGTTSTDGSHNHTGSTGASGSIQVGILGLLSPGAPGNHTHSISTDGSHSHTTSGTTNDANPPYLTVNFIIRAL